MSEARRSWVMRIDSDPVCYLWTGHGKLVTPTDSVDATAPTWLGAAQIISIPALKALVSGVSERVTFTLSGVNAETLRLAREDRNSVDGADVRIGKVEFDADWQLIGGVAYEWLGVADVLDVRSQYGDGNRVRSIVLSVAAIDSTRANPRFAYWTDASQRLRSPTDQFCDHVAQISTSVTRRFGPK